MKATRILKYLVSISKLSFPDFLRLSINLPCYCYHRSKGTRYLERKVNSYKMLLDLNDKGISKELMLLATREKEHCITLKNELNEGMTVLDIGANIGYYAVMIGQLVGESGKVYAVEPSVANYHMLNLNIKLNCLEDIVETFNVGMSNKTGEENFYESEKSNWHTFYPKVHSGSSTESLAYKASVSVPVITVEDFMSDKRKIELIRMDIEGYEVEVLSSLIPLIQQKHFNVKILFEVHQPRYDDKEHNMKKCLKKIFDTGYHVKMLASTNYDKKVETAFLKKGYRPQQIIKTDFLKRGIFHNDISNDDAIKFICDTDYVRTVLLKRKN